MNMEEKIGHIVVRLSDLKLELATQLEQAQDFLREYVVSKQYPINDRFEVWSEWCEKEHYRWVINEVDVPLIGKMVDDREPSDYFRHEVFPWLFFLECFEEDTNEAVEMRERYGVTVDEVKELLIETNFGSFRMDW